MRNSNSQGGGSGPATVIPAGGVLAVFVAAATNITPTYVNAPTWVIDGV